MNNEPNQAPTLERWLPSALSKALITLIPSSAISTFLIVRENPSWVGIEKLQEIDQTKICMLLSLVPALLFSLFLIVELIHIVNFKKHRIFTTNYAQPYAKPVFVVIAIFIFILGYYAGHP